VAEASEDEGRGIGGDALVHGGLHLLRDRALEHDGDARAEVLELARVGFCDIRHGRAATLPPRFDDSALQGLAGRYRNFCFGGTALLATL
jgi:hypothetical protein